MGGHTAYTHTRIHASSQREAPRPKYAGTTHCAYPHNIPPLVPHHIHATHASDRARGTTTGHNTFVRRLERRGGRGDARGALARSREGKRQRGAGCVGCGVVQTSFRLGLAVGLEERRHQRPVQEARPSDAKHLEKTVVDKVLREAVGAEAEPAEAALLLARS